MNSFINSKTGGKQTKPAISEEDEADSCCGDCKAEDKQSLGLKENSRDCNDDDEEDSCCKGGECKSTPIKAESRSEGDCCAGGGGCCDDETDVEVDSCCNDQKTESCCKPTKVADKCCGDSGCATEPLVQVEAIAKSGCCSGKETETADKTKTGGTMTQTSNASGASCKDQCCSTANVVAGT